jgi:hypothetical protein
MKIAKKLVANRMLFAAVALVLGWLAISPAPAQAQAGSNVVTSGTGTVPTWAVASPSFIDASAVTSSTPYNDLCGKIYTILSSTSYPSTGAVIDARGLAGSALTCASGTSPWIYGGLAPVNVPSVILLPTGTINIPRTWILPGETRIKGVGEDGNSSGTVIQPQSGFNGSALIQFGAGPNFQFGDSVENVTLNGMTQNISGIQNEYSQEESYVDHVNFQNFGSLGPPPPGPPALLIGPGPKAQNSGPYTNLFVTGGTGACVQIIGAGTRGVHGMTCTTPYDEAAGLLLDSGGNTIEDVHFEVFKDGILVGSNAAAASNVILNVTGQTTSVGNMVNVIEISNANTVEDLSIMGVEAESYPGGTFPSSIKDDVTGTTLTDETVAMYALGEGDVFNSGGGIIGYARFTTSPSVPNWSVGSSSSPGGSIACKTGSLYSNTSGIGGSHDTLFVCESGAWVGK